MDINRHKDSPPCEVNPVPIREPRLREEFSTSDFFSEQHELAPSKRTPGIMIPPKQFGLNKLRIG